MFRNALACAVMISALVATGCTRESGSSPVTCKLGETARLGTLVYTATETEWLDQLGEGAAARLPKNRFLAVGLTVTNGGVRRAAVPGAKLVHANGTVYAEIEDASGLSDWFGMLRGVDPAQTERGRILFDVPTGSYRLRVTDDADVPQPRTALIDLPYQSPTLLPGHERPTTGTTVQ